jgi:hypothetical protein
METLQKCLWTRIEIKLERVLLNNGKVKSSIPVALSVAKKESKESMSGIFRAILYKKHYCQLSGDLKVNETLFGLLRHSKLLMFLWSSGCRDTEKHYIKKDWPAKEFFFAESFVKVLHKK